VIRRLALGMVLSALAAPVAAQDAAERTNLRYDENWASFDAADGGMDRLKNLRLDNAGMVRVTLGLEARARYEGFAHTLWGDASDDGYLWLRAMPLADVHAGPARVFVQPIMGYARGVKGGNGPADQTGVDLAQGFADLRLPLVEGKSVTLRLGRELVALGSERLVGTRYGPNIPQPFDGVRAIAELRGLRIELMSLRAVDVGPGNFDDHASDRRQLRAVYATVTAGSGLAFDAYWIGYHDKAARFGDMMGAERRDTFGLRLFGQRGRIAWNWETMIQRGRFAGQSIRAWSQATETAISFPEARLHPRIRLRANYASGDRSPDDGTLGTFNALFPKGRYFGELTPIGPRNILNIQTSLDADLGNKTSLELSAGAFWRASRHDGIYDVPGQQIRPAGAARSRHVGNQLELSMDWQASATLALSASLAVFSAGSYLRQTGEASPTRMMSLEATYKF
jgi:hypothetical protein